MPLECHIQGFPGKFYCPRMATMNKPAYAAIQLHSPIKPVLVFVSSRRQTRLTALDLIAFAAAADRPRQFLHVAEHELAQMLARVHVSFLLLCSHCCFIVIFHTARWKSTHTASFVSLLVSGRKEISK